MLLLLAISKRTSVQFTALFVAILFAVLQAPVPMTGISLDWSFQGALTYFHDHGFHYGSEIIYTYGPLGHWMTGMYAGGSYDALAIGQFLYQALFSAIAAAAILQTRSLLLAASTPLLLLLHARLEFDSLGFLLILFAAAMVIRIDTDRTRLLLSGIGLAVVTLLKFTFFVLATCAVACLLLYLLATARKKVAAELAAYFTVAYLIGWIALCGQKLSDIPAFVYGSSQIASGYSKTLALGEDPRLVPLSILLTAGLVPLLGSFVQSRPQITERLFFASLIIPFTLMVLQQGFIRADSHIRVVPMTFEIVILFFLVHPGRPNHIWVKPLTCVVALCCAVFATALGSGPPGGIIAAKLQLLTRYAEIRRTAEQRYQNARQRFTLPDTSAAIGHASVDVFGDNISLAIYNGWHYTPRPVPQSFTTYTHYLQQRNAAFIDGPSAPDFYLLGTDSLDNRLFTETDGPALIALLTRYQPVMAESGLSLYRRKRHPNLQGATGHPAAAGRSMTGRPVSLPRLEPGALDEFQFHLSPGQRWRWKEAPFRLELHLTAGKTLTVNVPSQLGLLGFPVNPAILTNEDLLGHGANQVTAVVLLLPRENEHDGPVPFTYKVSRHFNLLPTAQQPPLPAFGGAPQVH